MSLPYLQTPEIAERYRRSLHKDKILKNIARDLFAKNSTCIYINNPYPTLAAELMKDNPALVIVPQGRYLSVSLKRVDQNLIFEKIDAMIEARIPQLVIQDIDVLNHKLSDLQLEYPDLDIMEKDNEFIFTLSFDKIMKSVMKTFTPTQNIVRLDLILKNPDVLLNKLRDEHPTLVFDYIDNNILCIIRCFISPVCCDDIRKKIHTQIEELLITKKKSELQYVDEQCIFIDDLQKSYPTVNFKQDGLILTATLKEDDQIAYEYYLDNIDNMMYNACRNDCGDKFELEPFKALPELLEKTREQYPSFDIEYDNGFLTITRKRDNDKIVQDYYVKKMDLLVKEHVKNMNLLVKEHAESEEKNDSELNAELNAYLFNKNKEQLIKLMDHIKDGPEKRTVGWHHGPISREY